MMHPDPEHFHDEPEGDDEVPMWARIAIGVIATAISLIIGISVGLATIQVVEWLR